MKLCILDNDILDGHLAETYGSFGSLFSQLFTRIGARWETSIFHTQLGHYPNSFDDFDAVLLTGSRADSFSDDAWVVELRRQVTELLKQEKKMVGVCFGHQLIALCLGAPVSRAPQGWGAGRMTYDWHRTDLLPGEKRAQVALLASHQDQVHSLPPGAKLVASSPFCPVASFTLGNYVFCIQPHPEFSADISAYLLDKRRALLGEEKYIASRDSLVHGHEGDDIARLVVAFLENTNATDPTQIP
jgi:GMP synthase-like glutamine amidotransferase